MIKMFQISEETQDSTAVFVFLVFLTNVAIVYHAVHWSVFLSEIQIELHNISLPLIVQN